MSKWLNIIGIGEDGVAGLSGEAISLLENAEVIVGGDRHHGLVTNLNAKKIAWPSPFDAMIDEIKSHMGKKIVILVTGDPLWYSVGARITRSIPAKEIKFFPQLSAFQLASVRMGWSLADCETLTIHGRATEQIIPNIAPNVRLLILTQDNASPKEVATLLTERGFGESRLSVLVAMGGPNEKRFDGKATDWNHEVPDFHTLAVECRAGKSSEHFGRTGLPDHAFESDGQLTKRVVRSATLSALAPYPDALLWDIGAGCGSIGIEWMRAARGAKTIAIEKETNRLSMIENNALKLGVPELEIILGEAPQALSGLARPDAIFIGGGIANSGLFEMAWQALREGGKMVANVVTLEGEALVSNLFQKYGGSLERIEVSSAIEVGKFHAMNPAMSVLQWSTVKPFGARQ